MLSTTCGKNLDLESSNSNFNNLDDLSTVSDTADIADYINSAYSTPNPVVNSNTEGGINFNRSHTIDKSKEISENHKREEMALNDNNKELLGQIRLIWQR